VSRPSLGPTQSSSSMGAGSFPGVKRPGREVHHQSTQRKIQEEFNVQRHRCENPKSLFHCPFDLTDRRTQISGFRRDVDEIALFWDITRRRLVIFYRRFGTTYRLPSSRVKKSKKMEPIRCPETSVKYYHTTLRNIPEERRSQKY
jgi:hypothetical protein